MRVKDTNPTIATAREQESIAKYDIARSTGAVLPTVSYTHLRTEINGQITWNDGMTIILPLQVGSYVNTYGMAKKFSTARSQREDAEAKTELDAEKFLSLTQTGLQAIKIKKDAVDSAQLSVDANLKSFDAGVRSTTDVLNSIQILFQTRNEYAIALAAQAESYLNLLLVQNEDPAKAMKQIQAFLFQK
jgi:outer membrane protein TolC